MIIPIQVYLKKYAITVHYDDLCFNDYFSRKKYHSKMRFPCQSNILLFVK